MTTILEEVLSQPVSVTQSNKSSTVTKGQALIMVLMNQATKRNRQYIDALITLTDKIGRLVEVSEDERPHMESWWFPVWHNQPKSLNV